MHLPQRTTFAEIVPEAYGYFNHLRFKIYVKLNLKKHLQYLLFHQFA